MKGKLSMKILSRIMPATLVLCLALLATSGSAQTSTTGTIEGTVTDPNGAVVPGATVKVTSPNLMRVQTATSDSQGRYRIANLPPGKYTVTVEAVSGFAKFEQADISVNLSTTTTADVKLQPQGATASVEVVAGAATVDVSSNTSGTNVSTEQFSNFPTQRTVQSLYTIAPTASRSGLRDASGRDRDPSVGGASGPENNYILDGVSVTDPAFGGSGANLPFEFVQEIEIKTGAYGADIGKSTGGVFNVITKSGSNEFHGDGFFYGNPQKFTRNTKNFPFTGAAPNGFSEIDAGFDLGGPIKKDKLWFFGAFNPQRRENRFLTQTFRQDVSSEVTTPFYAGKVTYGVSDKHILTFSTFGDFTRQEGFLFGGAPNDPITGFGADPNSFLGTRETGGHNYTVRLNSTFSPRFIGEFAFGAHLQRFNVIPTQSVASTGAVTDNFAILRADGTIAPVRTPASSPRFIDPDADNLSDDETAREDPDGDGVRDVADNDGALDDVNLGVVSYVNSPGGTLQRGFIQQGFAPGLVDNQDRNRFEFAARLQNNFGRHAIKYGFEYSRNIYNINRVSTGPAQTFANPNNLTFAGGADNNQVTGFRVANNFSVCTTRGNQIVCPSASSAARAALIASDAGFAGAIQGDITAAEALNNPFLVLGSTRVRDFKNVAETYTNVQSFYLQEEFKLTPNILLLGGLRWDFQQGYGNDSVGYIKLNQFFHNMQPRVGVTWDFTGNGRGKVFANYAKFLEAPIPLDLNVRAGSQDSQTDKNFNVDQLNAVSGSNIVAGVRAIPDITPDNPISNIIGASNLGASPTPIDGNLRPQTKHEVTAGFEYEIVKDLTFGARGVYSAQGDVIEDGSFDDGDTYFLFNPGRRYAGSTEDKACSDPTIGCFGRARRYYRALEFTATKRFSNNWQFITSYVYSSLIGNYEGLFRNDNGQSDPNITSLFDLVSLLNNTYGRLPNDRPHQFKFDGTYRFPFKLQTSASFRAQSGIPFDQLIPHPVYGNNEGFGVQRGTAINPATGSRRTPKTYNLDLGLAYPIAVGEGKELRLTLDGFNVTNAQGAIRQDTTFQINSGVTGVPPVDNPFFGQGTIFQFPTAFRMGAKFTF
jgi:outer membrane receptor protein involved in Fe transport